MSRHPFIENISAVKTPLQDDSLHERSLIADDHIVFGQYATSAAESKLTHKPASHPLMASLAPTAATAVVPETEPQPATVKASANWTLTSTDKRKLREHPLLGDVKELHTNL